MARFERNGLARRLYVAMINPRQANRYELDESALRKLVRYFLETPAATRWR